MSFGEDGIPKSGAWKQEYPVNGCADDMVLNVFFDVGADAKVNAMVGLPGSTRAGLVLQTDATRQVIFSLNAKAANVRTSISRIRDLKVTGCRSEKILGWAAMHLIPPGGKHGH